MPWVDTKANPSLFVLRNLRTAPYPTRQLFYIDRLNNMFKLTCWHLQKNLLASIFTIADSEFQKN
jgi:hypothetical protein